MSAPCSCSDSLTCRQALGFLSIAGETKLRLLPQPWPADRLPSTTASLLSISSNKGLLAAAGPDSLILASTDAVRQGFTADVPTENDLKPFTPQATVPIPRVSQVAFATDGSCLVISAEEGGGLAVYDTQAILQGQQESAFQLSTNGVAVRALIPNPAPEYAHYFALVLGGGQLVLANLKERSLVNGSNGPIFREGVSCVSWSAKGKQLVAGLGDGTAAQYDHQGAVKAQIPCPSQVSSLPMTTIYWLANDDFLTIHTPVSGDNNDSVYHIVHRDKASGGFASQKFTGDPTPAFGMRFPAHHFIARLRNYPPNLEDMLILSSTAGIDIGVMTKSSAPLAADTPADKIVNTYTTTAMANDSRRAQMPMSSGGMGDTSPIGMTLDLSSKELVKRPIPTGDIEESSAPLPALMLLNNEGVLSTWWIVYTESIQQRTAYPGLVNAGTQSTPALQSAPFGGSTSSTPASAPPSQTTPGFGQSSFGQPARPSFGSTSTPGFGGTSSLGARSSPWGTPAAAASSFGKPAFGSSTPIGGGQPAKPAFGSATPLTVQSGNTAFGAAGGVGNKPSVWGSPAPSSQPQAGVTKFGQPSAPFGGAAGANSPFAKLGGQGGSAFGAPSGENKPAQSPFANFGASKPASSPFANVGGSDASKPAASPFANFGNNDASKPSPFASFGQPSAKAAQPSFGSTVSLPSSTGGSFGAPSTLGAGSSTWGTPALKDQPSTLSREANMDDDDNVSAEQGTNNAEKSSTGLGGFKLVSAFQGDGTAKDDLPKPKDAANSLFGSAFGSALGETEKEPVTPVKKEPGTDEPRLEDISNTPASPPKPSPTPAKAAEPTKASAPDDAPLPPDFTRLPSKSSLDDAPLPPDFTKLPNKATHDDAALPPDFTKSSGKVDTSDAPLPPDFITAKPKASIEDDLAPIAGSPPVDLGSGSPELSPPASSDEGHSDDEEDDEGPEEGEWEDESLEDEGESDEDEELAESGKTPTQKTTSANSFGSKLAFPSQPASDQQSATSPLPSTTPIGLPKGPVFAPPIKESPRSPSPIRSASTPQARPQVPKMPSQTFTKPPPQSHSRTSSRPSSAMQPPPVPETAELTDDEDDRIRRLLESDVEPSKTLDAFVAHSDYVGNDAKPGIGGQIENVYRDVNSMIDTLGLNARSLEAFARGQEELRQDEGRERSDLEDAEDWCLVEVEQLETVEKNIGDDLESGRVYNVRDKLTELGHLHNDATRLRARTAETRKQLAARTDPDKQASQRNAPLDGDTEAQQTQLRQVVAKAQKLLQEAEEALSMLRTDLASISSTKDQRGVPTVEAVTNTILKMTAMIEQKSGDVDVLESQIRRLPRGVAELSLDDGEEDMLRSSMRGSRITGRSTHPMAHTPPASRGRIAANGSALGMSGMLGGRFRTPPMNRRSMVASSSPSASFLGQSVGGSGGVRKKMADVTSDEVRSYRARAEQRKKVLGTLKETVEKKGTRAIKVE